MKILVDSVGWVAFLQGEALADAYEPYLRRLEDLLCPTVVLSEVTRRLHRLDGARAARDAAVQLLLTQVVPLDAGLAQQAAEVGLAHRLALADSIVYATALAYEADVITSDAHFEGLPRVTYLPRP